MKTTFYSYPIGCPKDYRKHWRDERMKFWRKPVCIKFDYESMTKFDLVIWHFRITHCGHSTKHKHRWHHHQGIMVSFGIGGEISPRPSWWGWSFVIPIKTTET